MITEQELKQLENALNDTEWNEVVAEIKTRRNGAYPFLAKICFV